MDKKVVYTVYKVTNTKNSKFYVGVHKTSNVHDKYLGSGEGIKSAIRKYGRLFFVKEILYIFEKEEDAYKKEAEIVTPDLVGSGMCYNRHVGGFGAGIQIANSLGLNNKNKPSDHFDKFRQGLQKWQDFQKSNPRFSDEELLTAYSKHGSIQKAVASLGSKSGPLKRRLSQLLTVKFGKVPTKPGPPKKNKSRFHNLKDV